MRGLLWAIYSRAINHRTPNDNRIADNVENSVRASKGWSWGRFSFDALAEAESRLLSIVRANIISRLISVRLACSQIYTITAKGSEADESRVPLLFIHGFAAGVGIWAANIDCVAEKRVVHAIDLLGFGRSSRPEFSDDPTLAELQYVQSIEDWRREMNIEKMIIVAHSFGGFLSSSYALEHPERVRHLVLVDPWGFPEKPPDDRQIRPVGWIRAVATVVSMFNPLSALRAAGPYGAALVKRLRPDLAMRYGATDPDAIYDYIYQCNAQEPSGEVAFSSMSYAFGWARRPMIDRIAALSQDVPLTFIYGSKSWVDSGSGVEVQQQRPNAYVDVQVIRGAGHHVYADRTDAFNDVLRRITEMIDANEDLIEEFS
ncbi:Abhydrolase domain-containing protein 4 [Toxocara canis]|uniref:Abhydrolase domain-containing protein 4 n=1 Tax=Toxocara canis TaxID=6265 RepID=A0A0B2UZZ5_TOXCA|nr:Abhydrolase domain-containing protein 4 [Toxocara canis]